MQLKDLIKLNLKYLRNFLINTISGRFNIHYTSDVKYKSSISKDITVGKYTYIGKNAEISSKVQIGNYCMLATDVSIIGGDHNYNLLGKPMLFSGRPKKEKTIIGNDVWIGHRAIIMNGIKINDGAIIAAGAIVTKDVPECAIVAGIPAKIIKYRFEKEDIDKHVNLINNKEFRGLAPSKKIDMKNKDKI
jgi:acetyltransferase-like isoleucine patch superfamily enzyme